MAKQRDYLQEHGGKWRVRVRVPVKLQSILDTTVLTEHLRTASRKEADVLKHGAIGRLKEQIRQAERIAATEDPLVAEALRHRLHVDRQAKLTPDPERYRQYDDAMYAIVRKAEQIQREQGEAAAVKFAALASGETTPLSHHKTTFVNFKSYPLASADELDRALGWIGTWQKANHYPQTVESVDRVAASRFLREFLMIGRTRKTAAKTLSFIREYWKWMAESGYALHNPWTDQTLPNPPKPTGPIEEDNGKRPFTDSEVATLIYGPADPMMLDVMRIAALSGMRIEEIFRLRAVDCSSGVFHIPGGKTANSRRRVPIHSALADILARRRDGKDPAAFLIDDLPDDPPKSRESRSDPAVKRFTRYRRKMGIDERPNGKRVSNVDFHSFRRWFIRSARNAMLRGNAGFDEWTFPAVVGHTEGDGRDKTLDMSQQLYAGQDPETAKRNLVESVKLPPAPKK